MSTYQRSIGASSARSRNTTGTAGRWSILLSLVLGCQLCIFTSPSDADTPRLSTRGGQILDPAGNPILLRGYNWTQFAQSGDAAANAGQGANVVRMTLWWHYANATNCAVSYPNTAFDAYAPANPGGIDPKLLAALDTKIAWAASNRLWVVLAIRGGDCDFWTNPKVQSQFATMWAFLASHYSHAPYMGIYELLAEPHPVGDGFNNALVKTVFEKAIAAIRSVDAQTPIMVGATPVYNVRNVEDIFMPGQKNIIYTANFYELKNYTKQTKLPGLVAGSYPGRYPDDQNSRRTSCVYPDKDANHIYMNRAFLADLMGCLVRFRAAHNVPVFVQQVGIPTGVPGSYNWAQDVLDILNSAGIGWTYWAYRPAGHDPSDFGVMWQDTVGEWHNKTEWLAMLSRHMRSPPPSAARHEQR